MRRHIALKQEITPDIINKYFYINDITINFIDTSTNIDNINFTSITTDIYLYIIEKCRITLNYFKNKLEEFYQIIKNADETITFLTTKLELCDIRIKTLSTITVYLDIIINTSFKIKHLIGKLLYSYSYTKLQYYYCNFTIVIDKCLNWNKTVKTLLDESYNYLNLSYQDVDELCELFNIDKNEFISNEPTSKNYNIIYNILPISTNAIDNIENTQDTIDSIDIEFISSLDDIQFDVNMIV